VLDGDRRERGVHHERSGRLAILQQTAEHFHVTLAGFENAGDRLRQPGRYRGRRLGRQERPLEGSRTGRDPQKRPEGDPGKPHELRS